MQRSAEESEGLIVEGLAHRIGGARVVDDVAFAVPPGEIHCLIGASGCGKSTTLRLIAGLERLQQGSVRIDGVEVASPNRHVAPEARGVGLLFQDRALFPHLDVGRNVAFGLRKVGRSARRARVRAMLQMVGLADREASYPHELSGGEQQRVALARALAPSPSLLLLDEAFSALDAGLRAEVREQALGVLRRAGAPTLLVTHDADEAIASADKIHVMERGRIVQSASPDDLYVAPASAFAADLFGRALRFPSEVRGAEAATPFGAVAAGRFPDGAAVEVAVRPEALRFSLDDDAPGHNAQVVDCRRMGPNCAIALKLENGPIVTVTKPTHTPHAVGQRVRIELLADHAHVFAAAGGGPGHRACDGALQA